MGASLNRSLNTYQLAGIFIAFIIIIIVLFGVLGGLGFFSTSPSTTPSVPSNETPVSSELGSLAFFDNKWTKVFDSMKNPSKCFIDLKSSISPANLKKITKYLHNKNMLPIDNPFKNSIDVPVKNCSQEGSRLTLTLDLSSYGGINPFKQGDSVYIFGINGETHANSVIDSITKEMTGRRYIYATSNEYATKVLPDQIMISDINPCNNSSSINGSDCNLDRSLPLFSVGRYIDGGTVRFTGDRSSNDGYIPNRPIFMFYLYLAYKGHTFDWPFSPITIDQAYKQYSSYYNDFMQWYANLPSTCTQPNIIPISSTGLKSGPVTVSGGSGSGLQMYMIDFKMMGHGVGIFIVTNDGFGYLDGENVTVTQDSNSALVKLNTDANCKGFGTQIQMQNNTYLSYTTTKQQLIDLINYVLSLDPDINTIAINSNANSTIPDNYNNPNISISFSKTTPDTESLYSVNYIKNSLNSTLTSNMPICLCNGKQDQYSGRFPNLFFPSKINQCANQIIYTASNTTTPYDFLSNSGTLIGAGCSTGC